MDPISMSIYVYWRTFIAKYHMNSMRSCATNLSLLLVKKHLANVIGYDIILFAVGSKKKSV